jgi:23S rRNA pseudouridine1911/1915/1917 synthase
MSRELPILYESGPCLAVLKPSGLPTQAPAGIESAETLLKDFYRQREGKTGNVYLGVPHRLDRPVSGVLVVARHVRAARRLSHQFEQRSIQKRYWAVVEGHVSPAAGTWTDSLIKIYGQPLARVASTDDPAARTAILHYETLLARDGWTWLEIALETGRTHQIRIQAASRGWPVLGDRMYGAAVDFGMAHERDERQRAIALHARSLGFLHPMTREPVLVTAPLAEEWRAFEPWPAAAREA